MNTPLSYSVTRWKDGGWQHIDDAVSPEEPVYVSWSGSSCRLWAWPDDLEPLAIGHVLLDRRHLGPEAGPSPFRMSGSVRAVSVPPGIDAKHAFAVELKRMEKKGHDETPSIVMTPDAIVKHMDAFLTLEGSCPLLWESTGCFHRAGMFDPKTGAFLRLAEDIGRHNCLDRLGLPQRHRSGGNRAVRLGPHHIQPLRQGTPGGFLVPHQPQRRYLHARGNGPAAKQAPSRPSRDRRRLLPSPRGTAHGLCRRRQDRMIGVVLAGGRSTRLGQDKVRLRLPGDGRDMLARTADLLATCTDGVVISCRAPDAGEETLALPGIRSIPDAKPGLGPLGGVWSALRELRQPILVLSCDLPFMDMPTLRRLIDARGARPPEALMTTFQQAETGFIEALVSIYEPACLPFFEEAHARNLRQLNLVIPEKLQSRVVYTRAEALPFFNINFPGELEQARRMAEAAREQRHSTACHASEEGIR